MATTRSKPAAATKAVAATKPAKGVATPAKNAGAIVTAVAEPPKLAPAAPSGIERRRSVREKLVAPAVLQPSSGDASVDRGVQVQDLSLGGVGFVATEKFDPGEVYRITLGKGPLLLNARIRIISCNKTAHRMYRCGAEFC
jgi:PilZ domain